MKSNQKLKTFGSLAFFAVYAVMMLWEGVIKDFSATNWLWIALFVVFAIATYWSHKTTSIIVIGFLMIHTTLEMLHHGADYQTLTILSLVVLAVHFLFDCGFLWIEMKHHIPESVLKKSFALAIILYIGALCIGIVFGGDNTILGEGVEKLGGIISGTIFGCVLAHVIGVAKKLFKRR